MSFPYRIDVFEQMNEARFKVTQSSLEKAFLGKLQSSVLKKVVLRQLLNILVSRRGFGLSDPRDMIYAHLGLLDRQIFQVNYEKTAVQVFEMFVEFYVKETNDFNILAYVEDTELEQRRSDLAT